MKYDITININDFDKNGLKLFGYPTILSHLGYLHLKETDQGVGVLLLDRYAWAITAMKIQIKKRVESQSDLTGKTWYSGQKGPYYRREYLIYQGSEEIILGSSYSILLDVIDRSVFRGREFPFIMLDANNKHLLKLRSGYKKKVNSQEIMKRQVYNSYIDVLGHTNHLRYIEFIYDALTIEEIEEVNRYNTLELFFQHEMTLGDIFSVNKGYDNDNVVFILYNETKDNIAFTIVLSNE